MDDEPDPSESAPGTQNNKGGGDENSSDDEKVLDWTKASSSGARPAPTIPKRGEKEYEPAPRGGSSLQEFSLERSRQAMTNALSSTRTIASKSISYGVWIPGLARAQVFQARGVLFNSMGHSIRRPIKYSADEQPRLVTRLELLPEEALYLVERGSMLCFKQDANRSDLQHFGAESNSFTGNPMTVQQAFAEMMGQENHNIALYQCYAYLKRLGYIVTRAIPPPSTPSYPTPPPYCLIETKPTTLFVRLRSWLASLVPDWMRWTKRLQKFRPIISLRWGFAASCAYPSLFRSLRVIPSGHSQTLSSLSKYQQSESPYEVFYHVWKPNTPWKKTAPPVPDFELVVVDGRTTRMPTLQELTNMFSRLPRTPPPLPRRKNPISSPSSLSSPQKSGMLSFRRILSFSWFHSFADSTSTPKPQPFAAIRAGHKNVIIGVVDAGTVSFFRFGEGCFDEWPMM